MDDRLLQVAVTMQAALNAPHAGARHRFTAVRLLLWSVDDDCCYARHIDGEMRGHDFAPRVVLHGDRVFAFREWVKVEYEEIAVYHELPGEEYADAVPRGYFHSRLERVTSAPRAVEPKRSEGKERGASLATSVPCTVTSVPCTGEAERSEAEERGASVTGEGA